MLVTYICYTLTHKQGEKQVLSAQTYVHINDVVVDTGLVLLQHFEESGHIFTGGEELQIGLLDFKQED